MILSLHWTIIISPLIPLQVSLLVAGYLASFVILRETTQLPEYLTAPSSEKHVDTADQHSTGRLFFDVLIGAFTFFSGHQMYTIYSSRVVSGVTLLRLAVTSYLAYAIFASLAVSLELVWPLLSDGPLFMSHSERILHQCTETWWHVYLVPFNTGHSTITCASSHVYLLSISIHCILLGCVILFLLTKLGHRTTMSLCTVICTLLLMSTLYTSLMKRFTVISQQMSLDNLSNFILRSHLHDIYFLSPMYSHNFLLGMMSAFHVHKRIHLASLDCVKYTRRLMIGNIFVIIITLLLLLPPLCGWCWSSSVVSLAGHFSSLRTQLLCQLTLSVLCILSSQWKYIFHLKYIPSHWRQIIHVSGKFTNSVHLITSIYCRWYFLTSRHIASHQTRDLVARWTHALYVVSIGSVLLSLLIEPFTHHLLLLPFTRKRKNIAIRSGTKID